MILLIYIALFVLYIIFSVAAVKVARKAIGDNPSRKRIAGGVVGGIMFLLVFWDVIPVFVQHKYLCETQAGFWVYKTPEQWIKENPSMIGKLWGDKNGWPSEHVSGDTYRYWLSSRTYYEVTRDITFAHAIRKIEHKLVDKENQQVLANSIEFERGSPSNLLARGSTSLTNYKIWLGFGSSTCGGSEENRYDTVFAKFSYELIKLGSGDK